MLTKGLNRIRSEWAALRYEDTFRKLMLALKAGYRPDQARDEAGRWTDEGGRWMREQNRSSRKMPPR